MYYSIKQIEVFLRTSKTLSITKTANDLNMTVPAAWKHIKNLEELCEKELFSRKEKQLSLTKVGEDLAINAANFLREKNIFSQKIQSITKNSQHNICISITNTIYNHTLPFISKFLNKEPETKLNMCVDKWSDQQKLMPSSNHDFFIISDPLSYSNRWNIIHLGKLEFVLTASSSNKISSNINITIPDLSEEKFLITNSDSTTTKHQIKLMKKWRINKEPQYLDSYLAIKEAVKANIGISILPKSIIVDDVDSNKLKIIPIDIENFSIDIILAHKNKKVLNKTNNTFKNFFVRSFKI